MLPSISPKIYMFAFNLMHDWRAMNVTVHLAPRYQGHSLSVQCYEFCLHTILFMLVIQTRPPSIYIYCIFRVGSEKIKLPNYFSLHYWGLVATTKKEKHLVLDIVKRGRGAQIQTCWETFLDKKKILRKFCILEIRPEKKSSEASKNRGAKAVWRVSKTKLLFSPMASLRQ